MSSYRGARLRPLNLTAFQRRDGFKDRPLDERSGFHSSTLNQFDARFELLTLGSGRIAEGTSLVTSVRRVNRIGGDTTNSLDFGRRVSLSSQARRRSAAVANTKLDFSIMTSKILSSSDTWLGKGPFATVIGTKGYDLKLAASEYVFINAYGSVLST